MTVFEVVGDDVPLQLATKTLGIGQSGKRRSEEQAYRMLYALDQVAGALKLVGYAPR